MFCWWCVWGAVNRERERGLEKCRAERRGRWCTIPKSPKRHEQGALVHSRVNSNIFLGLKRRIKSIIQCPLQYINCLRCKKIEINDESVSEMPIFRYPVQTPQTHRDTTIDAWHKLTPVLITLFQPSSNWIILP
jgi:hypothetical protein